VCGGGYVSGIATIHQPDFLPWFGFFNKIAKADVWILLDHVENIPHQTAFWGRRVRVLVNGNPAWLSLPLARPSQAGVIGVPIREMRINEAEKKRLANCLKTVKMAYAKAKYFRQYIGLVEQYFEDSEPLLIFRNMRFIRAVMDILGLHTEIVESSSFNIRSHSTQLLVDLLIRVGAKKYLCGNGAAGYQKNEMLAANGIHLIHNTFVHPVYPQLRTTTFIPGLSIIDALFNVPTEQLADWVKRS